MPSTLVDPWPTGDPAVLAPSVEHAELRTIVRDLLERTGGIDAARGATDEPRGWSSDLWRRLHAELELSSMLVPEELGGAGFALADVVVVLEELAAVLRPEPALVSSVLAVGAVAAADDAASVVGDLRALMAGEIVGTLAWPTADLRVDDGLAHGRLSNVPLGAAADVLVLGSEDGLWLLEADQPGVEVVDLTTLDPSRRQGDVTLSGAAVTPLVGAQGAGRAWSRLRRAATIALAAEHVGMMTRLLDDTVAYVSTREQFGRPIGSFQAIKHRLADALVDVERARSATTYAAALHDLDPEDVLAAEVAGAMATDGVVRTVHEAVQLHGGIGFTWEHSAHLYVKRALGDEGLFGSAADHRATIAGLLEL